jgi:hypothetical protein
VEIVVVVTVVLLVVGIGAVLLGQARSSSPLAEEGIAPDEAVASGEVQPVDYPSEELVLRDDEVLVLAPAEPGLPATVLASAASLDVLERAGLTTPPKSSAPFRQLVEVWTDRGQAAERSRLQALADQPLEGRWLQVTEESAAKLSKGTMVKAKTGDMLGMVNNEKGQRSHQLRFVGETLAASPSAVLAAANLQATLALQAKLEEIEERLIEIQETLGELVKDMDLERLAGAKAANDMLEDVANQIRRRGRIRASDWDRALEAELELRRTLHHASWRLGELTQSLPDAQSRHQRVDVLGEVFKGGRLEYWLTVFADVQLARTRWDLIYLLHEATEYPDELGDLEATIRGAIAERERDLYTVGAALREAADPSARSWRDHLQQVSHFKLRRQERVVGELLSRHGSAFPTSPPGGPVEEPEAIERLIERKRSRVQVLNTRVQELARADDKDAIGPAQARVAQLEGEISALTERMHQPEA